MLISTQRNRSGVELGKLQAKLFSIEYLTAFVECQ